MRLRATATVRLESALRHASTALLTRQIDDVQREKYKRLPTERAIHSSKSTLSLLAPWLARGEVHINVNSIDLHQRHHVSFLKTNAVTASAANRKYSHHDFCRMRKAMLKMMHPVNPLLGNFISCAKSVPQHQCSPTQNEVSYSHPANIAFEINILPTSRIECTTLVAVRNCVLDNSSKEVSNLRNRFSISVLNL